MNSKILFLTILLMILTACNNDGPGNSTGPALSPEEETGATVEPLPTRPVREGTSILADGQLVTTHPAASLSFSANGHVLQIHVQAGDQVQEGDLIATLDDLTLRENVANAELQVAQSQNSVAQSQLALDDLAQWEADVEAIAAAEANLAAAQTALENAQVQDASSGSSLTSARIGVDQAERSLADAQKAYDTAFDPGREWEYHITEASCLPGQGGVVPCTGPSFHIQMKAEREGAARSLEYAQENLEIARAQYNLASAGLNNDTAVAAEANVASAQQTLDQAQSGPKASEIDAARLRLEQAELSLQQSETSLQQAQNQLSNARLLAPWQGTILTVEVSPGAAAGSGVPIVTLLNTEELQFQTSNLSERDLAQVEPGLPADITLKAFSDQTMTGRVTRIAAQADNMVGDAAVFAVFIDLVDDLGLNLRPGMTGRVEIRNES